MSVNTWKNILLIWINKTDICQTIQHNTFTDLEFPDIYEFYNKYRSKIDNNLPSELIKFLTDNFPGLDVAVNQLGYIECCDYIFVYTCFVHYAISIERSPFFIEKLSKLSPKIYTIIETVLRELLCLKQICINVDSISNVLTNCLNDHPNLELIFLNGFQINQPLPETPTKTLKKKNQEIKEIQLSCDNLVAELKLEADKNLKSYQKRVEVLEKNIEDLKRELSEKEQLINNPDCSLEIINARKQLLQKLKDKEQEIDELKAQVTSLKQENVALASKLQQANLKIEKLTISLTTQEQLFDKEIKMIKADYDLIAAVNVNLQKELQSLATQTKRRDSRDIEFSFGPNNNYLPNFACPSPRTPITSSPSKQDVNTPPCFEGSALESQVLSPIETPRPLYQTRNMTEESSEGSDEKYTSMIDDSKNLSATPPSSIWQKMKSAHLLNKKGRRSTISDPQTFVSTSSQEVSDFRKFLEHSALEDVDFREENIKLVNQLMQKDIQLLELKQTVEELKRDPSKAGVMVVSTASTRSNHKIKCSIL